MVLKSVTKALIVMAANIVVSISILMGSSSVALSAAAVQQGTTSLAPILDEVTPAVVSIGVSKNVAAVNQYFFNGPDLPDELRRFFDFDGRGEGLPVPPSRQQQRRAMGSGSGVIVDAEQGYVVSNHHVIEGAEEITVRLNDGRTFEATLVGSDSSTDIALLKIDADGLVDLEFADSDSARIGDFVVAIGNPFNIGQTVTAGIVSALGRAGINNNNYEDFIQTDAAINVGNSGGALVDMQGRLLGVNTAIISSNGGGSNGIGFAVPANMVATVIGHLEQDGEVRRGMLGVQITNVSSSIKEALDLDIGVGALVTNVLPGSAADIAGLEIYDVIVEIDGTEVENSRDLRNYIGLLRQTEEVELRLYRDGIERQVTAMIGDSQGIAAEGSVPRGDIAQFAGAVIGNLDSRAVDSEVQGVVVTDIAPQSRAWQAGLRQGDVISEVNRNPVNSIQDFNQLIADTGDFTAFTVIRDNRPMMIMMP